MKIRTLLMGACLIFASTAATAEVFKWTDDQGNIHFGDRRPDNRESEQVNVRVGKATSAEPAAPETALPETANVEAKENSSEGNTDGLTDEQRRSNCEIAQGNLETIETNSRIRITENGEQRYLTPEEIETKRKEMEDLATESCSDNATAG